MKTITVEVTQEDINNGKRYNGKECPVALALKRYIDDKIAFRVGASNIYFAPESIYTRLPDEVIDFITKVDCNQPVTPISFELPFFKEQLKPCLRN